jgi:hypothetical protein
MDGYKDWNDCLLGAGESGGSQVTNAGAAAVGDPAGKLG